MTWLAERREPIEVFFLPRYSQEFIPDEYLNGDLKARMHSGELDREDEYLGNKVTSQPRSLQKQLQRVCSCFRAKPMA